MDEPILADYPRDPAASPEAKRVYAKDGRLAIYVLISAGIGLLQHGFRSLGFSVATGSGAHIVAILLTMVFLIRLAGGFGLLVSRLWSFWAVMLSGLFYLVLVGPFALHSGNFVSLLWTMFSVYLVIYGFMRLARLEGPRPI